MAVPTDTLHVYDWMVGRVNKAAYVFPDTASGQNDCRRAKQQRQHRPLPDERNYLGAYPVTTDQTNPLSKSHTIPHSSSSASAWPFSCTPGGPRS